MTSFNQAVIAAIKECDAFGGTVDVKETLEKIKKLCVTMPGSHTDVYDRMTGLQAQGNWHNTVDVLNDIKVDLVP